MLLNKLFVCVNTLLKYLPIVCQMLCDFMEVLNVGRSSGVVLINAKSKPSGTGSDLEASNVTYIVCILKKLAGGIP